MLSASQNPGLDVVKILPTLLAMIYKVMSIIHMCLECPELKLKKQKKHCFLTRKEGIK